ncbi:hypothetical protein [Microbacterium schleiferi]|uniref:hypothetical protein n=1 Tax=Microbacterium schleiferi TaxID=69362 RepID=UPI00311F91A8
MLIIAALGERLDVALTKTSIPTGNGGRVELDGATEDLSILVEAYAHQGALRGGQHKKLATDALKRSGFDGDSRYLIPSSRSAAVWSA